MIRDFVGGTVFEQIIREARPALCAWYSPRVLSVTSTPMPPFATTCPRASHLLSRRCKISYARPALPHTRVAVREVFSHQHSRVSQFLSQDRIRKFYRFQLNRQHSSPCYAASTLAADPQGADDGEDAGMLASLLSHVV